MAGVGMKDVASRAGVSITTVSHVLNGTRRVAESTRMRVLEAAAELGYSSPRTVRSLRAGASPGIAIVGTLLGNAGGTAVALELARQATDAGLVPFLLDTGANVHTEEAALSALIAHRLDAVIISPVPGWRRHSLPRLRRHAIPFAVVNGNDPAVVAPQVSTDYQQGIRDITAHLLDHGVRYPVLFYPDRRIANGSQHMRGFEEALVERGHRVTRHQLVGAHSSPRAVRRQIAQVLDSCAHIDALVLGNSAMCVPAMAEIRRRGLVPGRDIRLAVFDDSHLPEAQSFLRAVDPVEAVAERAITEITRLLGDPDAAAERHRTRLVPCTVITGPSCGCPTAPQESSTAGTDQHRLYAAAHGRRHAGWVPDRALLNDEGHSRSPLAATPPPTPSTKEALMTQLDHFPDRFFPALHVRPNFGWVNDPNGIHKVGDTWHMFYQYNPKAPWHDHIHWGHATSTDLVNWTAQPIALKPRPGQPDSAGCWSGVGTVHEGVSSLLYTAVTRGDGPSVTVLAEENADRSGWEPTGVVATMPPIENVRAMRDPFIFEVEGRTYAIHGGGFEDGTPVIFLYECSDWRNWRYLDTLLVGDDPLASIYAPASIWECPQLIQVGEAWVLIVSQWVEAETLMDHLTGVAYLVGDLDMSAGYPRFVPRAGGEFDAGPDFYAPQCVVDGERVLAWGWTWEGSDRTDADIDASGYNGALTYPRQVRISDGRVWTEPAPEIFALREGEGTVVTELPELHSFSLDLAGSGTISLRDSETNEVLFTAAVNAPASLWMDGSLVELFQEGTTSFTQRIYPRGQVRMEVSGELTVTCYRLSAFNDDGARLPRALR
ncbi:LacI family DNA-binding transcriptional regulator [Actinotignum timonense]|uniref:LacI family DNA-binding transcriptional regulator n=1 Tax=Actinotignum timonense TaxID=1870995 RepID=UPI000C77E1D8|nr:LacI family DNA-binding transcriptional regulator [Actinotignum timonense]WOS99224.1 LacI family DNA-binding transcriptional regulator [Actinotignum timonense]